jgi:DNA primase
MDLKEKILDELKLSGGYKTFYKKYFQAQTGKDIWTVKCPFHIDHKPSLSVNTLNGLYHCFSCGAGGDIFKFRIDMENIGFRECLEKFADELNIPYKGKYNMKEFERDYKEYGDGVVGTAERFTELIEAPLPDAFNDLEKHSDEPEKIINLYGQNNNPDAINRKEPEKTAQNLLDEIDKAHENIFSEESKPALNFLIEKRGLTAELLNKFLIGYNGRAITIPFFNETGNELLCIKYFDYNFSSGEKHVTAYGKANLFGLNHLESGNQKSVIICEGEIDAMVMHGLGYTAVSGSAGAGAWRNNWNKYMVNKDIIICYDSDKAGRKGACKVVNALLPYAKSVRRIDLYPETEDKDHKDISDYFITDKKSKEEFDKLINDAKEEKAGAENIKPDLLYELMNIKNEILLTPAQDFVDDCLYYAVKINDEYCVINSFGNCFSIKEAKEHNIKFKKSVPDIFRFSSKGIIDYLNKNFETDACDLYKEIYNYIKEYIFLKEEKYYILISLWVMGTYIYKAFRHYPYIHLNAEKGSGKTLLMEILAPISFNGQISCNSSEAVLYRDIQNNCPTLFMDEVEKLGKEDNEKFSALMSVLKTGFSESGIVKRCCGKNFEQIQQFSTYSPKVFAGIKDIDDVLGDRTFKIRMVRKLNNEVRSRYIRDENVSKRQADLRDALYIFGLQNAAKIFGYYKNSGDIIHSFSHLGSREIDIWLPLISISMFLDEQLSEPLLDELFDLSCLMNQEKEESDTGKNDTTVILRIINELTSEVEPARKQDNYLYYQTDNVLKYFQSQDEFSWLTNKSWLTKQLKMINIKSSNRKFENKSQRYYIINTLSLKDFSMRYLNSPSSSVEAW